MVRILASGPSEVTHAQPKLRRLGLRKEVSPATTLTRGQVHLVSLILDVQVLRRLAAVRDVRPLF